VCLCCICFFVFLSVMLVMLVLLHFMRNKLNNTERVLKIGQHLTKLLIFTVFNFSVMLYVPRLLADELFSLVDSRICPRRSL